MNIFKNGPPVKRMRVVRMMTSVSLLETCNMKIGKIINHQVLVIIMSITSRRVLTNTTKLMRIMESKKFIQKLKNQIKNCILRKKLQSREVICNKQGTSSKDIPNLFFQDLKREIEQLKRTSTNYTHRQFERWQKEACLGKVVKKREDYYNSKNLDMLD